MSEARQALIRDLKMWACSPRVPEKVQLLMLEAIGALGTPPEAAGKDAADAARYRYLKDNRRLLNITIEAFYPGKRTVNGAEADSLIDWYMKEYPVNESAASVRSPQPQR